MKANPSVSASARQIERLDSALAKLRYARTALAEAQKEAGVAAQGVFSPTPPNSGQIPPDNNFVDSTHMLWEITAEHLGYRNGGPEAQWSFAQIAEVAVAAKPQPSLDQT